MKHNLSELTKGVITTLRQKRLFFATILVIGVVSLGAAWSGIASARGLDFSQSVSGFFQVNDLEECLDISFIGMTDNGDGTTKWTYSVERQPCDQEVDSWMIEIPACSLVASALPAPYDVVFPDPDLSKDVVKWDLAPDFESGVFSVTLAGDLVEGQATAGLSDSTAGAESLIVEGPECDPTLAVSTVVGNDDKPSTPTITVEPTQTEIPFETATETPEESGLQAETLVPLVTETPSGTPVATETDDGISTPAPSATPTGTLAETATPRLTQTPVITGTPSANQPPAVFVDANMLTLHYVAESNQTMTVNCDNGVVIVSGESNEINIAGQCGMLVLQGDRNQVNLDFSALISNSGSENVVSVLGPILSPSVEEPTSSPTPGTGTPTGTPFGTPSGTPGSTATPTPGTSSTPTLPVRSTPTPGATSTESVVPSPTEAVTPTEP